MAAPTTDANVRVVKEQSGNYLRLIAEGSWEAGYPSVASFLRAMGVDPDEWEIREGRPNSWPTSGWDSANERPWTVINHQVTAKLLRKQLQPLQPQVQPVNIRSRPLRRRMPGKVHHGYETTLFITDPHFGYLRNQKSGELLPFHDRRLLDIGLQMTLALRPQRIIFGGDTLDLPDWSDKFVRSPEFYHITQPAVLEANWWLAQYRSAVPGAEIVVLEGNHDARMPIALMVHLNQVYQLRPADEMKLPPAMSLPRLLALHKLNIQYIGGYPDADYWLSDVCKVTHGDVVRGGSGATTAAEVKDEHVTLVHGHIHRHERATRTVHGRYGPQFIHAICPGCACHIDGRVPGKSRKQNWQQGIAVIRHIENRMPTVTVAEVHDGEAFFEGAVYRGAARVADLARDTDWPFEVT